MTLRRHLSFTERVQLPGLGRRRAGVEYRNLDAAHRPGLAGADQLTHNNAAAMGVVLALQSGPHLLLLPLTGFAADHLDRRKLLSPPRRRWAPSPLASVSSPSPAGRNCGRSTCLRFCWAAYGFDSPARHTFVAELVGKADLANAVALNSTSFNAARMIGRPSPAR